MVNRLLTPSLKRSFFLFGARGTGKSTLIETLLPKTKAFWFDLLDPELEARLSKTPNLILQILETEKKKRPNVSWVVIDEIQKLPALLGIVHKLIREKSFHFALTGSSARKLKRAGADLLAGRASYFELFPFLHEELGDHFDLLKSLNYGSLAETLNLETPEVIRYLRSYCHTYLKEEIVNEQIIRKIQPFREFLELAALQNGQVLNYAKTGSDIGVDTTTVQNYYSILSDTLLGYIIPPFHESIRKRQRANPKFYFFDLGVTRTLAGQIESPLTPKTTAYGRAFEHFFINEVVQKARTLEKDWKFSYILTKDGSEIDLIIDQPAQKRWAIEIKSNTRVDPKEVRAFSRMAHDLKCTRRVFVSQDPISQTIDGIECLDWKSTLINLFE